MSIDRQANLGEASMSELQELRSLQTSTQKDLIRGFQKAQKLAEALNKKFGNMLEETNVPKNAKPLNEPIPDEKEVTEAELDKNPMAFLPKDEPLRKHFVDSVDRELLDEDFDKMLKDKVFGNSQEITEAAKIVKSDLEILSEDAAKMARYVERGAVDEEEANEILVHMVEYLDKSVEKVMKEDEDDFFTIYFKKPVSEKELERWVKWIPAHFGPEAAIMGNEGINVYTVHQYVLKRIVDEIGMDKIAEVPGLEKEDIKEVKEIGSYAKDLKRVVTKESITEGKAKLELWKRSENYSGEDMSNYYVGPGKSRDSEVLERSNFDSALEELGGEDGENVVVGHFGHWAVGWIEQIFVNKNAKDKVAKLQEIADKLEDYPVLDDDDYYQKEADELEELFDNNSTHLFRIWQSSWR